jgi:hypothetical protein
MEGDVMWTPWSIFATWKLISSKKMYCLFYPLRKSLHKTSCHRTGNTFVSGLNARKSVFFKSKGTSPKFDNLISIRSCINDKVMLYQRTSPKHDFFFRWTNMIWVFLGSGYIWTEKFWSSSCFLFSSIWCDRLFCRWMKASRNF